MEDKGFLNYIGLNRVIDKIKIFVASFFKSGNGINIEDGTINVTNPNKGIWTKKEYDALDEEEKKNGTYIVEDGDGVALVDSNIYSKEETVVGRWIDGRPLYRRVIETTTPSDVGSPIIVSENIENILSMQKLYGIIQLDPNIFVSIPAMTVSLNFRNFEGIVITLSNEVTSYRSKPCIITAEYTKTTDPAITGLPVTIPSTQSSTEQGDTILDSKVTIPKRGKVEVDGEEYEYEIEGDMFGRASATASNAGFGFAYASASSAKFNFSIASNVEYELDER